MWKLLKNQPKYRPSHILIPSGAACEEEASILWVKRLVTEDPTKIGPIRTLVFIAKHLPREFNLHVQAPENLNYYRELWNEKPELSVFLGLNLALGLKDLFQTSLDSFFHTVFAQTFTFEYEQLFGLFEEETWKSSYEWVLEKITRLTSNNSTISALWHTKLLLLISHNLYSWNLFSRNWHLPEYFGFCRQFFSAYGVNEIVFPLLKVLIFKIMRYLNFALEEHVDLIKLLQPFRQKVPSQFQLYGGFTERREAWKDYLVHKSSYIAWPAYFHDPQDVIEFINAHLIRRQQLKFPLSKQLAGTIKFRNESCSTTECLLKKNTSFILEAILSTPKDPITRWQTIHFSEYLSQELFCALCWQIQANYLHFGTPLFKIPGMSQTELVYFLWEYFEEEPAFGVMALFIPGNVAVDAINEPILNVPSHRD